MTFRTYTEAADQAKKLGAVKVGLFYPRANAAAFSAHFFDAADREIGFYHYDLNLPLHELNPRREWAPSFLATLKFEEV